MRTGSTASSVPFFHSFVRVTHGIGIHLVPLVDPSKTPVTGVAKWLENLG